MTVNKNAEMKCPICGSSEVGGVYDLSGELQRYWCSKCKAEWPIKTPQRDK